ncbi:MAG: hypothetical protein LBR28_03795 [Bacteroidales bacterium]|jgi:hypothetical protein|nr:hypothetical protein [Bacteroidales bacterium]
MNCKVKFLTLITAFIFITCGKQTEDYNYGMSITVPNVIAPISDYNPQQINLLRAANVFQILALQKFFQDNKGENIAVAALPLFENLSGVTKFNDYFTQLYTNFDSKNKLSPDDIKKELDSIGLIIKAIDSSLLISSSFEWTQKDSVPFLKQSLEIFFLYSDALQTENAIYDKTKHLFSITDVFKMYESDNETVAEIPFGNQNYSIILIKPNMNIETYIDNFSERKYKNILDSMIEQHATVVFPKLDFTTKPLQFHFPVLDNMKNSENILPALADSLRIQLQISILFKNPTLAMLALTEKTPDKQLPKSLEHISKTEFGKDFIFLIRGRYSNMILLLGVCSK